MENIIKANQKELNSKLGKEQPTFIINYAVNEFAILSNDADLTLIAGNEIYSPHKQTCLTFFPRNKAIHLAKTLAREYAEKF